MVPLTDVALSALARLRHRAESFGMVELSHYVFASFVPKFTFSGKRVIGYSVTAFDATKHVKSWRSAWRTLTKKAKRTAMEALAVSTKTAGYDTNRDTNLTTVGTRPV